MKGLLYFLSGAAVGAVSTYLLLKGRYNESEKEFYARKYDERKPKEEIKQDDATEEPTNDIAEKPDIMEYAKILAEKRYSGREEAEKESAYVISKDEFDDSDNDAEALIFYADGVLAYETTDEIIENADEIVGTEFKDRFGEYEEDTVFVRNDEEKIDYEIIKDKRTYEEVSGTKPHGTEE